MLMMGDAPRTPSRGVKRRPRQHHYQHRYRSFSLTQASRMSLSHYYYYYYYFTKRALLHCYISRFLP